MRMYRTEHKCLLRRKSVTRIHCKLVRKSFSRKAITFLPHTKCVEITQLKHNKQTKEKGATTHRCVSADRILLGLPVVPGRSHDHFFVEAQVFHFHGSNEHRFGFFDYDILQ